MLKKIIILGLCMVLVIPAVNAAVLLNNPPEIPNIDGPAKGKAGTEYEYQLCSSDPDGDKLSYRWFHYPGAGKSPMNLTVEIKNPESETVTCTAPRIKGRPQPLHIILEVKDDGNPCLYSYRRLVLNVSP